MYRCVVESLAELMMAEAAEARRWQDRFELHQGDGEAKSKAQSRRDGTEPGFAVKLASAALWRDTAGGLRLAGLSRRGWWRRQPLDSRARRMAVTGVGVSSDSEVVTGDVPGGPSTSQTIMVSSLKRQHLVRSSQRATGRQRSRASFLLPIRRTRSERRRRTWHRHGTKRDTCIRRGGAARSGRQFIPLPLRPHMR